MKRRIFLLTIILALVMSLPVFADDYTDVMNKGKLVFGTAPDYIPFVFYDDTDQLTGIDVALMQEVGRRMGVRVEVVDMAFDGLMDALNIGQVDVIGGALSKTEERAENIDFSRVYYKGEALFVTKNTTPKPAQANLMDFRGKRIGVQRGTSFDQWVKTNLIMAGYVGTRDVYSYSKVADAVKAMDRGDVDFVLMDEDVFEDKYKGTNKYQVYLDGFAEENYAFGLRKDSTLTLAVNGHLANMMKDGTAQKIANKFFSMNYNEAAPSINRPSQVSTPIPYYPTQPATCVNSMSFVKDVTIKDGHQVSPNERFTKTWRIYNNGSCTWNSNYTFVFVSGDQMNGRNVVIPTVVQPGQTVDVSVAMTAPQSNGTYRGYWQMRNPQGQNFGQTLWAKVRVKGGSKPTQVPTTMPAPSIRYFYADPATMPAGETPNVIWSVSKAATVMIQIDGKTVYNGKDQKGSGRFKELAKKGRHEVKLIARNVTDDSFASFWYQPGEEIPTNLPAPIIDYFYADPETMPAGQNPTIRWTTRYAGMVVIQIDGNTVYEGPNQSGAQQFSGLGDGNMHNVQLIARNVTDDSYASFSYQASEVIPTNVPGPFVDYFYADPASLPAGQIPTIYWGVSSNTATVVITIDGNTVYNGMEQNGSASFSELGDGNSHTLQLLARNVTDDATASFVYEPKYEPVDPVVVDPPTVDYFYPDYYAGPVGEPPTVYWSTSGAQTVVITVDGQSVYSGNSASGSGRWDILGVVGSHTVEILARNVTGDDYGSFMYNTNMPLGDDDYIDTSWQNERPWENEPVDDGGWDSGVVMENVDYGAPSWADVPAPEPQPEPVYEEPVYDIPAPAPQPEPVYEEPAPAPQPEPTKTPEPEPEFFLGGEFEAEG